MEERYEMKGDLPTGTETGWLSNVKSMIAAALTGLAWGILGALIGGSIAGEWAPWTVLAGPPIGLVIHLVSRWSHRRSAWWLIPWAIVSTYLAAAIFGLALGSTDALRQVVRDPGDIPNAWKHVAEGMLACLWGLTFLPILWSLFPLAAGNHLLIRWLAKREMAQVQKKSTVIP